MKLLTLCRASIAAMLATVAILCIGCDNPPRENILKVYNWGDYIDESMLADFESWYEEQTGEKVKVVYQTFDINEVMLAKIEKGEADFDVVCPSEYIIERMMYNDMLIPIRTESFEKELNSKDINYLNGISPYITEQFSLLKDKKGRNANEYAVGYMWGTTGLLYNRKYVKDEEAESWALLFDKRFKDKIFIKDAFRDVYTPMLIYAKTLEARQNGQLDEDKTLPIETIRELMFRSDDESIALVEGYLKRMKELVAGWEADFGKEMMTQEKAYINLMWSGDAVWAIEEAAEIGVELDYRVPREGSIVWFDGWVIPKYAKNVRAARYFINYMCKPENAIRNMEETGYVSVIGTREVMETMGEVYNAEEHGEDAATSDLGYFFRTAEGEMIEGADSLIIDDVMYPDRSVIERCGVMHDSGKRTEQMLEMWSRVKGDNLSPLMVIFIVTTLSIIVIAVVWRKIEKRRKPLKHKRKRQKAAQTTNPKH